MTDPNWLNVSKDFENRSDGYVHPEALNLPKLPNVRKYVLADEDQLFLHRDFSGQEMRIFAHFESGELAAAYHENPDLDPHVWVKEAILRETGRELERTRVRSIVNGRRQSWEYKLINYLIQGSAADVTKEAINRWYYGGGPSNGARFLLTVYDEINITSERSRARENMQVLREVMNGIELDVPMRSEGKIGERWGQLEKCE
jgi:DNA polymerase I-like protein with 3'-5' exonuclease and polymerase domains